MTRLERADRIGWVIAILCVLIVVSTYLMTPSHTPANAGGRTAQRTDVIKCDRTHWNNYVGVGDTRVLARVHVTMKACWRKASAKRNPGKVLDSKGFLNVKFWNTAVGDFHGATWNKMEKWRPQGVAYDNRFRVTRQQHVGFRQCVGLGGQRVCGPTADFSVGARFNSPYLVNRSDGSIQRWSFVWFQGEPGKAPGSFDDNVWICDTMCR